LEALPRSRALLSAGSKIAARIAMIAMTTRSSIRVKQECFTPACWSKAGMLYSSMLERFMFFTHVFHTFSPFFYGNVKKRIALKHHF